MDYKGFTIRSRTVLTGDIDNDYYVVDGETQAYEVIEPKSGYILSIFSTAELAKKAIDKNGERWLKA